MTPGPTLVDANSNPVPTTTEKTPEQLREEFLTAARRNAARAIQQHFSSHPESVMIVSVASGVIRVDVTEFTDAGTLLFSQKILDQRINAVINDTLNAMKNPTPAAQ